ncbi:ankyrin repeat domain-containing protein [Aspergillus undulatus]|uniref:ankyrin repeat domain-containing protein n=1 Tax=Aspergillus undulatus TaxID=1810928 RepID=UPI003CCE3D9E
MTSLGYHRITPLLRPGRNQRAGDNLNERDQKGATPHHCAARRNDKGWVCWLIEHGADVNAHDNPKPKPLHEAAGSRADEITKMLLMATASPSVVDAEGFSAFHYAALAANIATVRKFIAWILDVNQADGKGVTAPYHAADDGWIAQGKIKELVRAGANIDARNSDGQTALNVAAHELVQCGASVNAMDMAGITPLIVLLDS